MGESHVPVRESHIQAREFHVRDARRVVGRGVRVSVGAGNVGGGGEDVGKSDISEKEKAMALGIQVVFDAADPRRLAEFWALALDYELQKPPEGFRSWEEFAEKVGIPREKWDALSAVVAPDNSGPRLLFQKVPEGKTAKNRVHLDVNAASRTAPGHSEEDWRQVEEHVRKLAAAGATVLREVNEVSGRCVVMQDPEGNEFCVH
jgi:hypothetical protein